MLNLSHDKETFEVIDKMYSITEEIKSCYFEPLDGATLKP